MRIENILKDIILNINNTQNLSDIPETVMVEDSVGAQEVEIVLDKIAEKENYTREDTPDVIIKNELTRLNIKLNNKNIDTVKTLLSHGLPVNKEFIKKIIISLDQNNDISIPEAAVLVLNGLEVEPENLKILNSIAEGDFKISSQLKKVFENIMNYCDDKLQKDILDEVNLKLNNIKDLNLKPDAVKEDLTEVFDDLIIKGNFNKEECLLAIRQYFVVIKETLETIRNKVYSTNFKGREEVFNQLENIIKTLTFMDHINDTFIYLQLPIYFGNRLSTAELYIFPKEKDKSKWETENTTFGISLDTFNLGCIDLFCDIKDKNISIKAYLESESVMKFLQVNYKFIYHKFLVMGYRLVDIKYQLGERLNILNAYHYKAKESKRKSTRIDLKV